MSAKDVKTLDLLELGNVLALCVAKDPNDSMVDAFVEGRIATLGMLNGSPILAPVDIDVSFDASDDQLVRQITIKVGWNAKEWDKEVFLAETQKGLDELDAEESRKSYFKED